VIEHKNYARVAYDSTTYSGDIVMVRNITMKLKAFFLYSKKRKRRN